MLSSIKKTPKVQLPLYNNVCDNVRYIEICQSNKNISNFVSQEQSIIFSSNKVSFN